MNGIESWAARTLELAYAWTLDLAPLAMAFLLLAVYVHRRNLRNVLLRMLPGSTRVNLTAYLIDALFIMGPISFAAGALSGLLITTGIYVPVWDKAVPAVLVGAGAVFFGDFIAYFRHRLEHSPLLWSSHVLHHSDATMNWMTVFRFHPFNRLSTAVIDVSALTLLGFPPWSIALNFTVRHYWGLFIHANLPWTLGPLGHVLVSPAMHRWHHVRAGEGVGSNFASVFSVFDRAFGTRYVPGPCDHPLGVEGVRDQSYISQLVLPLITLWRFLGKRLSRRETEVHELVR